MIDKITTPQCFNAFNSSVRIKEQDLDAPKKVKAATIIGAGLGTLGSAYLLARRQNRLFNKSVGMFSLKYNEPELIGVAVASIAGGLAAGGLVDDKKYFQIKVKEAIHQTIANVFAPLLLISGLNKIYDKYQIKKFPQFAENKGIKKVVNGTIKMLPRLALATIGVLGGVCIGTSLSNKLTGLEGTKKERHIKPVDFIYHPDDFAAAVAIADKKGVLQKFISKVIPPIFMLHGYDTGTRR